MPSRWKTSGLSGSRRARRRARASAMGCEIGRIRPTKVFERAGESRMMPPASSSSSQVRPRISFLRQPVRIALGEDVVAGPNRVVHRGFGLLRCHRMPQSKGGRRSRRRYPDGLLGGGTAPHGPTVEMKCSAPGFLDSGLKVITSTLPRPVRRNRVALGLDSDSRTSPASTARCTSVETRARRGGVPRSFRSSAPTRDSPLPCG